MILGRNWGLSQTHSHVQLGSSSTDTSVQGPLGPSESIDQTFLGWELSEGFRLGDSNPWVIDEEKGTHD